MIRKILFVAALVAALGSTALAQFTPGQVLGAAQLNAAFASHNQTAGSINGTPIGNSSRSTGAFTSIDANAGANITGSVGIRGSSSGTVSITTQAAAGTYNFNLPTTSGSTGQLLLSGSGAASPMTWGTSAGAGTSFAKTDSGTFTATLTGCSATTTASATYVTVGQMAVVNYPTLACTSNATTATITGAPAAIQPASARGAIARVQDATGSFAAAQVTIGTDGVVTLKKDVAGNVFTNTGSKSASAISFTYGLN